MGWRPVLAREGRLGEAPRPVVGVLGGRGGRRPSGCRRARARGEPGELAPVEAGERSRRWLAVWMQAITRPWRSVRLRPWRPASMRRWMRVRRRLRKVERSGRSQRGGAVPASERAVGGFSGLVGGGLSGSTGARVPRGRERLGRERADVFDPDSVGRESRGRKPVGPRCKTRLA
jgi:hypothetical protein